MINKIELLAPAGNLSKLKTALHFGADAVYGALNKYGLRAYADNFSYDDLQEGVNLMHSKGKKFYLTLNAMPYDNNMQDLLECAKAAYEIGVDAAIVSDIGVMSLLHDNLPELELHISTQANTLNSSACNFYNKAFNASRIILARELSLDKIIDIRKNLNTNVELEAFVHGAMCMAYSGRCLLSNAMTGRGGNQGACAQSCRWKYQLIEAKRPGESLPIYEDKLGTYIMSSFDLCMIDHLDDIAKSGINSIKIEGRMKSEYYVACVVNAYRVALDKLYQSTEEYKKEIPQLLLELDKVSHRACNTGFYYGNPESVAGAEGVSQSMEYVAQVLEDKEANEEVKILLKNRIFVNDDLEILSPSGINNFKLPYIKLLKNNNMIDTYGVANEILLTKIPYKVYAGDILRGENRNHK